MAKAKKYKKFPAMKKKAVKMGDQPSMANWRPTKGGFAYPKPMKAVKPMTAGAMSGVGRVQKVSNFPKPITQAVKATNNPPANTQSTAMKFKKMCKSCGKKHAMGKHANDNDEDDKKHKSKKKGLKLVPPSKGHKPKGAHGRAAVRAIGRTKTTGNFARIAAAKGKGAAIAAYQAKLAAHKGK